MNVADNSVAIEKVRESPTNPRKHFDKAALAELAANIKLHGVLQPILVRPDPEKANRFECVFGHRRLRAAKLAELDVIPAIVRPMTDVEVLDAQLAENLQRADIHPLEEADAYKAAVDTGLLTAEDLAHKVGKSRGHVYARIRLAEMLRPKARKALFDDDITLGTAMLLSRIGGKAQDDATATVIGRDTREARWQLRIHTCDLREAPFKSDDADLVAAAGPCTTCPKRSGNQRDLFGALDVEGEEPEICTDPKCFAGKVDAAWVRAKTKAEAKGLTVLELKKGERWGHEYVPGDQHHPDAHKWGSPELYDKVGKKKLKQLVGKNLAPVLARDPHSGAAVELYERKKINGAMDPELAALVRGKKSEKAKGKASGEPNPADVEGEYRVRLARAVRGGPELDDRGLLLAIAENMIVNTNNPEEVFAAMGWAGSEAAATLEVMGVWLEAAKPDDVRRFLVAHALFEMGQSAGPIVVLSGISPEVIREGVVTDLRAEFAEKAAVLKPAKSKKAPKGKKPKTLPTAAEEDAEFAAEWEAGRRTAAAQVGDEP